MLFQDIKKANIEALKNKEELVKKIVSMAVQDLRQHNQGAIVDVIKKSEFSVEWLDHDNWNGGIDTYNLVFHFVFDCLKFSQRFHFFFLSNIYSKN